MEAENEPIGTDRLLGFCFAAGGGKPIMMTLGQAAAGAKELTGLLTTSR